MAYPFAKFFLHAGLRPALVLLHRWMGLLTAGFLTVAGVTGAVISWDHELDAWLNPHLLEARAEGPPQSPLELARQIEARHPQVRVVSVPLAAEPGHTFAFGVEPRVDPISGRLFAPGFNQVFVDPASGEELGRRDWGAVWPLSRENFVSFLYVLHFSLHLPEGWGIDRWGLWLMGGIALVWTLDCFVSLVLTLPTRRKNLPTNSAALSFAEWRRRWQTAWRIRLRGGPYKLNFDLHRAGGLWAWGVLGVVAFTAFSLNLYREVFFPAMSLVSEVTPTPFDVRVPSDPRTPIAPRLDRAAALRAAETDAQARGWAEPAGAVSYASAFGVYSVQFFRPQDGHGAGGVGHRTVFVDGVDGRVLSVREPWRGTAADLFVQAQFPLHSGRILGLPGRIAISLTGLLVAMLSVTGVVIWLRKRTARRR